MFISHEESCWWDSRNKDLFIFPEYLLTVDNYCFFQVLSLTMELYTWKMMYSRCLVQSYTKSSFCSGSWQLWWLHITEESFSLSLHHLSICSKLFHCRIFLLLICWNSKTVFCASWQVWNAKIKFVVEWSFTWFTVK